MSDQWECDCEVVDDPDKVCPKHQEILVRHVRSLESENARLRAEVEDYRKDNFNKQSEINRKEEGNYFLRQDRDFYKLLAEKCRGALEEIIRYFGDNTTLQSRIAKQALALFPGEKESEGSLTICPDCKAPVKKSPRMNGTFHWAHPVYECPKIMHERMTKEIEAAKRGGF